MIRFLGLNTFSRAVVGVAVVVVVACAGVSWPRVALADPPTGYYDSVDPSNVVTLRTTLHATIHDHTRYPYTSEAADTWDNLGLNFNKPGVGFVWDPDTETITVLPLFTPEPIISDTLETFIGIEIPPQGDVTENPPEPPVSVVGTENAVTEVEVLPEPV